MEDLAKALGEYGINLKKPAYYTWLTFNINYSQLI